MAVDVWEFLGEEVEDLSILSDNALKQDAIKQELAGYKAAFSRNGIELSYSPTRSNEKRIDVTVKDRKSGEEFEVLRVGGKEDFIKSYEDAAEKWLDSTVNQERKGPLTYDEIVDQLAPVRTRFADAYRKVTRVDRPSAIAIGVEAKPEKKEIPLYVPSLINKELSERFFTLDEVGYGWRSVLKDNEPLSFSNRYTGEEFSIILPGQNGNNDNVRIEGKITEDTANVLNTFCRTDLLEITGTRVENFTKEWEKFSLGSHAIETALESTNAFDKLPGKDKNLVMKVRTEARKRHVRGLSFNERAKDAIEELKRYLAKAESLGIDYKSLSLSNGKKKADKPDEHIRG